MSIETTIFGKLVGGLFSLRKRKKEWDKFDEIVAKYGLEGCGSTDELESKFNRMESKDRVHFLKMCPDFLEYVEHAKKYPGTPYNTMMYD